MDNLPILITSDEFCKKLVEDKNLDLDRVEFEQISRLWLFRQTELMVSTLYVPKHSYPKAAKLAYAEDIGLLSEGAVYYIRGDVLTFFRVSMGGEKT